VTIPTHEATIHYFAYGSNLHPYRLHKRVPSARLIGVAPVAGLKLDFSKRGNDGSGKCTIVKAGGGLIFAAIFNIDKKEQSILDQVEGAGYERQTLQVRIAGKTVNACTYIALGSLIDPDIKPFHWYKDIVIEGAIYLSFPNEYLEYLNRFECIQDQNDKRSTEKQALLVEMKTYSTDFPFDGK